MTKSSVFFRSIAITFTLLIILSGHALAKDKYTVKLALDHDANTMNIVELKDGSNSVIFYSMHQGLLQRNYTSGAFENVLAESIDIMENGKDFLVKLRKGPRFHTGEPVTAHDFKFTLEQLLDPQNSFAGSMLFEEIEEIEVVDDHTLIYKFYEPFAPWKELLPVGVVSKSYYEKAGREKFRKQPVGSGPFRFVEWKIGEHITMEAVKDHIDYKPEFKTLKFMIVPDPITRLAMLATGEIDMTYKIMPHQIKRMKRNKKITIKRSSTAPNLIGIFMDQQHFPVLKDPKLKRAINHGINRKEIVEKIFLKEAYPLYGSYCKGEFGFNPDLKIAFDPEKARKLVKESSYKPGQSLTLTYTSKVINSRQVAAIIQKYLQDIGLTIKLRQLDAGVMATYNMAKDKKQGPLQLYIWGAADPYIKSTLVSHSSGMITKWTDRPNQKRVDELIDRQVTELDEKKRIKLLHELEQELEYGPGIALYGTNMIYAMNKRIDYTMSPLARHPLQLWNIKLLE